MLFVISKLIRELLLFCQVTQSVLSRLCHLCNKLRLSQCNLMQFFFTLNGFQILQLPFLNQNALRKNGFVKNSKIYADIACKF